jgi:hypothetical protein
MAGEAAPRVAGGAELPVPAAAASVGEVLLWSEGAGEGDWEGVDRELSGAEVSDAAEAGIKCDERLLYEGELMSDGVLDREVEPSDGA